MRNINLILNITFVTHLLDLYTLWYSVFTIHFSKSSSLEIVIKLFYNMCFNQNLKLNWKYTISLTPVNFFENKNKGLKDEILKSWYNPSSKPVTSAIDREEKQKETKPAATVHVRNEPMKVKKNNNLKKPPLEVEKKF